MKFYKEPDIIGMPMNEGDKLFLLVRFLAAGGGLIGAPCAARF
jgi:hypothetical protein